MEGQPGDDALRSLREGIQIWPDFRSRPAKVERLEGEPVLPPRDPPIRFRLSVPTAWLAITLTEGRNRQVRRMTAAVGFPTLRLVRVAIGEIGIDGLAPGHWRRLNEAERSYLRPFGEGRSGKRRRQRVS